MYAFERTATATTLVCADGIGSGIKANVAANMAASRLLELLRQGFSQREAFSHVVQTMEDAKHADLPYVAFSLARILNGGETTVLSYEAPGPLLVGRRHTAILPQHNVMLGAALTLEANCHLEPGEGILLMTDGITQAGLGGSTRGGWRLEGANRHATDLLANGVPPDTLPARLNQRAVQLSSGTAGDDCTTVLALCRLGKVVTVFTGPPADAKRDREVARNFLAAEGTKVICGATTADIIARYLGTKVTIDRSSQSMLAPPGYLLDGIDLVTEGSVTLNQVYNVLDVDPSQFDEDSGVTSLYELLVHADRVNFILGTAQNPANWHISFQQRGLLPRTKIVELLADKLREAGKLVVIQRV